MFHSIPNTFCLGVSCCSSRTSFHSLFSFLHGVLPINVIYSNVNLYRQWIYGHIYVYIIYVYMFIYTYMYMYMCVCAYKYKFRHTHTCTQVVVLLEVMTFFWVALPRNCRGDEEEPGVAVGRREISYIYDVSPRKIEVVRFSMNLLYSIYFCRISLSHICFGCYRSNTKPRPGLIGGFL